MLGLGWTEMLVLGVAALIFIGPKELPTVMHQIGKFAGMVRRMGNEFQREISKSAGLDEIKTLRNSITAPLKQTSDEIRREFNSMSRTGTVTPTGVMKPLDPKAESVVDEIRSAAGLPAAPAATSSAPVSPTAVVGPLAATGSVPAASASEAIPTTKPKTVRAKRPAGVVPVPTSPVTISELNAGGATSELPAGGATAETAPPVRRSRVKAFVPSEATGTGEPVPVRRTPPRRRAAAPGTDTASQIANAIEPDTAPPEKPQT